MPNDFSSSNPGKSKLHLPAGVASALPTSAIMPTGGTGNIRDISSSYWFGPLQPVNPVAPASYRPRQYGYAPGANLIWQPRGEQGGISSEALVALSKSWDLLRIVIETQLDRLCARKFEVRAKKSAKDKSNKDWKQRNLTDPNVQALNNFLAYPDGLHPFPTWLRMWLEDMIVLDAATLYLERDMDGRIASVHPIWGGTINRMMTDQGITPPPPYVAYQQVVYGSPACDFTTNDLIYFMRNEKTYQRYGYSPVEQILLTISIAIRRQTFQLDYYTAGNIPEALCFLPDSVTIDQVKEVQDWFDSIMSGDLANRRRFRFMPGYGSDAKPNVVFPKEPLLKDEMDEWLAKVACYCIGVSAQPFMKMMNRASAEQAQETSETEGQEPFLQSIESVLNVLIHKMGFTDYEVVRQQPIEMDILKAAQADNLLTGKVYTINEVRERRGEDPRAEDEADQLGVFSPQNGFLPLAADKLVERQKTLGTDAETKAKQAKEVAAAAPAPPAADSSEDGDAGSKNPPAKSKAKPKPNGKAHFAACQKHTSSYPRTYCHACTVANLARELKKELATEAIQ